MNILPVISNFKDQMEVIYKDFHQHPEIGFEEVRTSQIVAQYLQDFGVDEVHTEIGVTGVVGVIRGKHAGNRRVGCVRIWMPYPFMRKRTCLINRKRMAKCTLVVMMPIRQCC